MRKNNAGLPLKALVLMAALGLGLFSCIKAPTDAEVKASMQVTDVTSRWISKLYQPWPPKLILIPTVSFRVKNVSAKRLTYVDFNAVFRFKGDKQNLGDNYYAAIQGTPVMPGELSPVITLKSNYGVEGRNLASFATNPQWRPVEVRLFAVTHGSRPVELGIYDISPTIDFKEPEPTGQGKTETPPEKKK